MAPPSYAAVLAAHEERLKSIEASCARTRMEHYEWISSVERRSQDNSTQITKWRAILGVLSLAGPILTILIVDWIRSRH